MRTRATMSRYYILECLITSYHKPPPEFLTLILFSGMAERIKRNIEHFEAQQRRELEEFKKNQHRELLEAIEQTKASPGPCGECEEPVDIEKKKSFICYGCARAYCNSHLPDMVKYTLWEDCETTCTLCKKTYCGYCADRMEPCINCLDQIDLPLLTCCQLTEFMCGRSQCEPCVVKFPHSQYCRCIAIKEEYNRVKGNLGMDSESVDLAEVRYDISDVKISDDVVSDADIMD